VAENENGTKSNKEKTKEQREEELIPRISMAIKLGISVIDSAFEKLDVTGGNSDSENEDNSGDRTETLLEPKVGII
jgi:WASH complex subunit FAM21